MALPDKLHHLLNISWLREREKNWNDEARVHFITQTGWPSRSAAFWLHFPSERHPSSVGQGSGGIHQNSLCSMRYTKEPLRIRDGLLCLWLSTLGPLPSTPAPAWCELISHPSGLARRTITCTPLEQTSFCIGELYHISVNTI